MARYKKEGNKIELFYFLPIKWLDRALSGLKDDEKLKRWWGRSDISGLRAMSRDERRDAFVCRFKELGYASVKPWPIYERADGGPVMYYMVHATDHPEAPKLMARAYNNAISTPREDVDQLEFALDLKSVSPKVTRTEGAA